MKNFGKTIKPRKFGSLVSIQASVRPIVYSTDSRGGGGKCHTLEIGEKWHAVFKVLA